jgi:sugar phosphate isomerase/epimerase
MSRPVTLFTGQWADLPLETMAQEAASFGYDGLELACWGDHVDVRRAVTEKAYCDARHAILAKHKLKFWAISNHLVGQAVCDNPIDHRHKAILPAHVWGDGEADGVSRSCACSTTKSIARARHRNRSRRCQACCGALRDAKI